MTELTNPTIFDIVDYSEEEIDIGYWALVVAKDYDSSIDMSRHLNGLDHIAAIVRDMVGDRDQDMVKFLMTKMYLYESGDWNEGRTFSYDLDDPLGQRPGNQLLSTYLATYSGNCVSMPTLFISIMERVDPDIQFFGVSAPLHLFCRLDDRQTGKVWNIETTSGGEPARNEWYIEQFNIPQVAIDSGTYLSVLTKKQYVAELIGTLVAKHRTSQDFHTALKYTDLMLELNPRSVTALVHKGAISAWLGQNLLDSLKRLKRSPSASENSQLVLHQSESEKYIARARSLGWRPESQDAREEYLNSIRDADSSTH